MQENSFVHLHLHTEYSLLDGVSKIGPLIKSVKDRGMNACAITDHGVMYGTYEFWSACKEEGIKPIIGCEVYIAFRSRHDKQTGIDNKRYHLTLLAKNLEGYKNLLKIVSIAHTEGFYYKPRADKELLSEYGKGIIALTGCLGSNFNRYLQENNQKKAEEWLVFLKNTFDEVYVELQKNGIKQSHDLIETQVEIAKKHNLNIVATCDTHYINKEDHKIQEIAWCISDGKKLNDPDRRHYGSTEFYVKSPQEMNELFTDYPEAVKNTQKIADSIEVYNIEFDRIQPRFDVSLNKNQTKELLRKHTLTGASKRYGNVSPELQKRIDYELKIIHEKGYDDYFLVVEDYVNWAKKQKILIGPGRGSGAGSVVSYSLGITNLDPIKWDLIFERFLNPERMSPPDFDIDFQDDRRDELFAYMTKKYGVPNTSFIGTFGRLKTKAAIRDVARVMGIDLAVADKLSKMVIVKFGRVHSIEKMRLEVKEFDQIIKSDPQLEILAGYVTKLENLARHVSTHACGYLVTPTPVTDYVPVQLETKGGKNMITQIEGYSLEPMGLMKFDFLGLSNLTVINNTIKQVQYSKETIIDIDTIPLDDKKTFELFQKGKTIGVFQFESSGMQKYLKQLKPNSIEDLIFLNAAYRPGPMEYIPNYIKRKQGKEKVKYPDPSVEHILKSTFGFAIYQEQVIQIAVDFAGYSLGEADMLRRAMGKKKPEVMAKEKQKFIEGAIKNNHPKKTAEELFAYLEPFADYGFNRSHSACYSFIAYQTAYLKAHYPLEFLAGIMETDIHSSDKLIRDLNEANNMGIKILPPHVNKSFYTFSIDKTTIRFGLGGIKGGGEKVMKKIVDERIKNGEFTDLLSLIKRLGIKNISKKDLEILIKVGALDDFGSRKQLIEYLPLAYDFVSKQEESFRGGQNTLFFDDSEVEEVDYLNVLPETENETDIERLNWEKELLGAFVSSHPLAKFHQYYITGDVVSISKAKLFESGTSVKLLGLVNSIKVIYTKKDNKPMAFITFEDEESKIDCVIFNSNYEIVKHKLKENLPLILDSKVNNRNDEFSLVINDIIHIQEFSPASEISISIVKITDKDELTNLKNIIKQNPGNFKLNIIYGTQLNQKKLVKEINPSKEVIQFLQKYKI